MAPGAGSMVNLSELIDEIKSIFIQAQNTL
jgi:hypothetical protein